MSERDTELPQPRAPLRRPRRCGLGRDAPRRATSRSSSSSTCSRRQRPVPGRQAGASRAGAPQQTGSLARALVDGGDRLGDGVARMLAARHRLPLVDLAVAGVDARGGEARSRCMCSSAWSRSRTRFDGRRAPDRRRRSGEPARDRRAAARDAPPGRARGRLARRRPARDPPRSPAPRRRSGAGAGAEATTRRTRSRSRSEAVDRPRGRRRRLRRAARAARQLGHLPGGRGRRLRRPLRAAGGRRSSSASGSTACSTRCSGSPSGSPPGVTTRLKVLAKLDIAERRKPQDGRISLNAASAGPDARHPRRDAADGRGRVGRRCVSSTSRSEPPTLEELGLSEDDARRADASSSRGRPARCSSPARPAPASRRRCSPR